MSTINILILFTFDEIYEMESARKYGRRQSSLKIVRNIYILNGRVTSQNFSLKVLLEDQQDRNEVNIGNVADIVCFVGLTFIYTYNQNI